MGIDAEPMGISNKQVHSLLHGVNDFVTFPKVHVRSRCLVFTDREEHVDHLVASFCIQGKAST